MIWYNMIEWLFLFGASIGLMGASYVVHEEKKGDNTDEYILLERDERAANKALKATDPMLYKELNGE